MRFIERTRSLHIFFADAPGDGRLPVQEAVHKYFLIVRCLMPSLSLLHHDCQFYTLHLYEYWVYQQGLLPDSLF